MIQISLIENRYENEEICMSAPLLSTSDDFWIFSLFIFTFHKLNWVLLASVCLKIHGNKISKRYCHVLRTISKCKFRHTGFLIWMKHQHRKLYECWGKLFYTWLHLHWMDRIFRKCIHFCVYLQNSSHIVLLFINQLTCFVSDIIKIGSWHFAYNLHELCGFAQEWIFSLLKMCGF